MSKAPETKSQNTFHQESVQLLTSKGSGQTCVCADWSEPLLVALTTVLVISCRSSIIIVLLTCVAISEAVVSRIDSVLKDIQRALKEKEMEYEDLISTKDSFITI